MKRLALLVVLVAVGCGKCQRSPGAGEAASPVERQVPKGAVGVVLVPSVQALGARLTQLEALKVAGFAGQLQGFSSARQLSDALVGQLGIDVRSAEAIKTAGLDPRRGLAVFALVSGATVVALPVSDAAKFQATAEKLSAQRLGTTSSSESTAHGYTMRTFSAGAGQTAKLGYTLSRGYALVSTAEGVAKLAGLVSLPESDSLVADPSLKKALEKLGGTPDVIVYLPSGSLALARAPLASAVVTIALQPTALGVSAYAPWKDPAQWKGLERSADSEERTARLPRDAFAVARFDAEPVSLAPVLSELLGPHLQKAFEEAKFEVKREVLEQLKPGVAVSLSLADRPPMGQGLPTMNLRTTNPFNYVHLAGVASAVKAEPVEATLEKVAQIAPTFGAKMSKENGRFVTTYSAGEGVHFAARGPLVLFGSPLPRLEGLLSAEAEKSTTSPVSLGAADDALSVAIDLQRLAQSVRELPESAWGLGGFAIKATTVRWLDATDDLKRVTVGLKSEDQALRATLVLSLGAGAP